MACQGTPMGNESSELPYVDSGLAVEVERWSSYLGAERRMSPKTTESYARDLRQFLTFLSKHLGGPAKLQDLCEMTPQDVRAFMAARRTNGVSSRSLMRNLAGARSFARFIERNGMGRIGAFAQVRAPKIAKSL